ncbi:chemotaxis protein CheB [Xanthobacter sp. TB0139]|uniref:chemotaxis protein CheB n=1 Tax=Xanthobacter sp. TB0139 TaxID=3459178 RepID=UPI004039B2C1
MRPTAIVIGASAGGPAALQALLSRLEKNPPFAVVIVNHIGSQGPDLLADILSPHCALPVQLAREREQVTPGMVHIAPSGYHLQVERSLRFSLSVDAKVHFSRPAIDILFESAATAYGRRLAALVLTGASEDGAAGLATVRRKGGMALVQSPQEAAFKTMPQAAINIAGADVCAPIADLADHLNRLCQS